MLPRSSATVLCIAIWFSKGLNALASLRTPRAATVSIRIGLVHLEALASCANAKPIIISNPTLAKAEVSYTKVPGPVVCAILYDAAIGIRILTN